jgi:hypothetical protein
MREVDTKEDGYIDYEELEAALLPVKAMGVPGSPWKFYVDYIQVSRVHI